MRAYRWLCLVPALLAAVTSAAAGSDPGPDRQILLGLQARQRAAHLGRDAGTLVSMLADDFVSISDGEVQKPGRDALRRRFEDYFASVEFLEWADIVPPEITISDDGTMATIVVSKRVRLRPIADAAAPAEETEFAWLEVWRKRDGKWSMTTIASTDTH